MSWIQENLELVGCDVCGAADFTVITFRPDSLRVVECAQCGMAYLNPRPKAEFMQKLYDGASYFDGTALCGGKGGLRCSGGASVVKPERQNRILSLMQNVYGPLKGTRVLEIGCATGDLMAEMKALGVFPRGIEISQYAASLGRSRGLDIMAGTVEDFVGENGEKFDMVVALEVIEHVSSPVRFVSAIRKVLSPRGLLVLGTPNYQCSKIYGGEWYGFNTSFEHLYFFSRGTLTNLMSRFDFDLKYWETSKWMGGPADKKNSVERMSESLRIFGLFAGDAGWRNAIKSLFYRGKGYYPYGAGHSLIAVFALS